MSLKIFGKFLVRAVRFLILRIIAVLLTILVVTIGPLLIILCTPIYLFRFFVSKIAPVEFGKIVSSRSCFSAIDIDREKPTLTILVAFENTGVFDIKTFRQLVMDRCINYKDEQGNLYYPEMQQFITTWLGFYFWKWDKNFDIENHVNIYDPKCEYFGEEKMMEIQRHMLEKPYPKAKSPWEMFLIEDFKPTDPDYPVDGPKFLLYYRGHHTLADGLSIHKMLMQLGGHVIVLPKLEYPKKSTFKKILYFIGFALRAPYEGVIESMKAMDFNEWHLPEWKMTKELRAARSKRIPMSYLKEIKTLHNVGVTPVILAGMAGGIRSYMLKSGKKVPKSMYCGTAMPMPGHPDNKLRNYMTVCLVKLPVGTKCPIKRVKEINKHFQKLKTSTIPISAFYSIPFIGCLFAFILKMVVRNALTTIFLTNVPGPVTELKFDGHPIISLSCGIGLLPGNSAMGFTILSYFGGLRISCFVDKAVISKNEDVQDLVDHVVKEFEILCKGNLV